MQIWHNTRKTNHWVKAKVAIGRCLSWDHPFRGPARGPARGSAALQAVASLLKRGSNRADQALTLTLHTGFCFLIPP